MMRTILQERERVPMQGKPHRESRDVEKLLVHSEKQKLLGLARAWEAVTNG